MKIIASFMPKFNFKSHIFLFILFFPLGISVVGVGLAGAAKSIENPKEIILALIAFGVAVPIMMQFFILSGIRKNKVSIFGNGIKLYLQNKGKREIIPWLSINKVEFDDDGFGKYLFIYKNNSDDFGLINLPLKNMENFIETLKSTIGKDHILISETERYLKKT